MKCPGDRRQTWMTPPLADKSRRLLETQLPDELARIPNTSRTAKGYHCATSLRPHGRAARWLAAVGAERAPPAPVNCDPVFAV